MAYGIDSTVQATAEANRGNPQALQQKYAMTQQLTDLLAMQKLKSDYEAAQREMTLAAQQQPGTVADQRKNEVMQMAKSQVAQRVGGVAQQQAQAAQQQMQRMATAGQPPSAQPRPGGIAGLMGGGMVKYQQGGAVINQLPTPGAIPPAGFAGGEEQIKTDAERYMALQKAIQDPNQAAYKQRNQQLLQELIQQMGNNHAKVMQYIDSLKGMAHSPSQVQGMSGGGIVALQEGGSRWWGSGTQALIDHIKDRSKKRKEGTAEIERIMEEEGVDYAQAMEIYAKRNPRIEPRPDRAPEPAPLPAPAPAPTGPSGPPVGLNDELAGKIVRPADTGVTAEQYAQATAGPQPAPAPAPQPAPAPNTPWADSMRDAYQQYSDELAAQTDPNNYKLADFWAGLRSAGRSGSAAAGLGAIGDTLAGRRQQREATRLGGIQDLIRMQQPMALTEMQNMGAMDRAQLGAGVNIEVAKLRADADLAVQRLRNISAERITAAQIGSAQTELAQRLANNISVTSMQITASMEKQIADMVSKDVNLEQALMLAASAESEEDIAEARIRVFNAEQQALERAINTVANIRTTISGQQPAGGFGAPQTVTRQ